MSDDSTLDTRNLDKLIRALKEEAPMARIGIMGAKNNRTPEADADGEGEKKKEMTNALVGAIHEFGSGGMPVRSFLRMPLTTHLSNYLIKANAFDEETLKQVVFEGELTAWMKRVAIVAEGIVAEAFDTGGFGAWKKSNMSYKKNKQTLVETQQLRNSITSEVVTKNGGA